MRYGSRVARHGRSRRTRRYQASRARRRLETEAEVNSDDKISGSGFSGLKDRALRLAPPAALFLLNAWLCRELFSIEYTRHVESIEAAYISISRIIMRHWGDLRWFPEWYGGIPQQNSYPPLLHMIVAAWATAFRVSPALAHHTVCAVFYALGPVTLYLLCARLAESRAAALLAGAVYSLVSPSALLSREIAYDCGGRWSNRRLNVLVAYGEGPHIASLTLLPLALWALDRALASRKPLDVLAAALAMASVAVTNWLGAFALAAGALCLLLARTERIGRGALRAWLFAALVGTLAYAIASPWIPPSTIRLVRLNSPTVGEFRDAIARLPEVAALGLAGALALKLALERFRAPRDAQFFALFFYSMGGIAMPDLWFHFHAVPQPERYHNEMDLALCGLAAVVAWRIVARFDARVRWGFAIVLVCLFIPQVHRYRRYAGELITPIDMRATQEWKMIAWFGAHAGETRVFAPGAVSYWMNAFNDVPQFGGGFDQCRPFPLNAVGSYLFYAGPLEPDRHLRTALDWMRAYGIREVGVAGEATQQVFRTFRNPGDYAPLEALWRGGGGDAIYRVPAGWNTLAHVVRRGEWVTDQPPDAMALGQIERYDAAIERQPAQVRWTSRHSAVITAGMHADEFVSFQENWHPGWRATANGRPCRVSGDGLGLMLGEPRCEGPCRIELVYDGGWEMKLAWLACALALGGCVAAMARRML